MIPQKTYLTKSNIHMVSKPGLARDRLKRCREELDFKPRLKKIFQMVILLKTNSKKVQHLMPVNTCVINIKLL